jgi:hypothetical protein
LFAYFSPSVRVIHAIFRISCDGSRVMLDGSIILLGGECRVSKSAEKQILDDGKYNINFYNTKKMIKTFRCSTSKCDNQSLDNRAAVPTTATETIATMPSGRFLPTPYQLTHSFLASASGLAIVVDFYFCPARVFERLE